MMATREELFAAVRLIKEHCKYYCTSCKECLLYDFCNCEDMFSSLAPSDWPELPDPKEGGGEDG